MKAKKTTDILFLILLFVIGFFMVFPLLSVFLHSLEYHGLQETQNLSKLLYKPFPVSLKQYLAAVSDREILYAFWNSVKTAVPVTVISLLVSVPGGYGLAKFRFPCRKVILFVYVMVMLLPVQVMSVGMYLWFDRIHLLDTLWSVILSSAFSPLGAFIMYQFMRAIPDEMLENARMDGAGELTVFCRIVLPQTKAGLSAMVILILIDVWNLVETPAVFLQSKTSLPMAVFLKEIDLAQSNTAFASVMIFAVPLLLLFSLCKDALSEGIGYSIPVKE